MQVVLLERVERLGQMGDVVSVKDGYARNYLLSQGKARRATKENLEIFENQRSQIEAQSLDMRKEADAVAVKLEGTSYIFLRQAGEAVHSLPVAPRAPANENAGWRSRDQHASASRRQLLAAADFLQALFLPSPE